ncbi:DNA damage-inducible protein 1-like [Chenopodium quinoa]|nr:DNA damage-inducible protein 1-like [Chenopodium quinoa]
MTVESKQTEEACEVEPDEEEPSRLGAVHMLYAMGKEEPEERSKNTELMYVEVLVNGRRGNAMIDTGATHNFISQGEARRLGLKPIQEGGSMKAVNSAAKPVHGVARNIPTKLGDWSGNLDFTVATMDDYLVLGMDFLRASKAVPMPHLG